MYAHQKNASEQRQARFPGRGDSRAQLPLPPHETRQRQQHHEDFENLHADGHRPFAAAVRKETARHGKQNERQREQRHDQFAQFMFLGEGHVQPDEQEHDEVFQDVVAERALELRDNERPESAKGGGGVWRPAFAALWRGKLASGVWGRFRYHDRKANHSRTRL